jgi:uncharacterized protein
MANPDWILEENTKTNRWHLSIPEGLSENNYPTLASIKQHAALKGIALKNLLSDELLEKNIEKAKQVIPEAFSFPIVLDPSFDVRIIISSDKTSARLYIRKAADPKTPLDLKLISTAISNSRLEKIDREAINNAIKKFQNSPEMELNDFILSEGFPPTRGKDRVLVPKLQWLNEEETQSYIQRINSIEIKQDEVAQAALVLKDELLFEISETEQGQQGLDVFGKTIPPIRGNDPLVKILSNAVIAKDTIQSSITGLCVCWDSNGIKKILVLPYKDAQAHTTICEDKMSVSLTIEPSIGAGTPASIELAKESLAEQGITQNIDEGILTQLISDIKTQNVSKHAVVVRGLKPVKPGGSRIQWIIHPDQGGAPVYVSESNVILEIQQLSAGADGYDIFGTVLPSQSAENEIIPDITETIHKEPKEDNPAITQYRASIAGELLFSNNTLTITNQKVITGDINDESGDISFPGHLVIEGNIQNGHAAKASGELTITGNAGTALVSADGSVKMTGGIHGAGKGIVWAKQEITLAFAENAKVLAGKDIFIHKYCFQCVVKTNGVLHLDGNPGILLGGAVHASKGVEVFELGSEKTIRTTISFGQNYLVGDQIDVCEKEVEQIKEYVQKIDQRMKQISNENPEIHTLRQKKLNLLKRNDKLTVRIFTLKEQYETHIPSHIRVENNVYPGVILESHGRYFEVREKRNHVIFIFDQTTGQITCNPIPKNEES